MSLSKFYCDIVAKATIDHSNAEIRDIKSAVEELLNRLVSGDIDMDYVYYDEFQSTLKFRCSYLQPCGSMKEETALWKSVRRQGRDRQFIEFDFLVVLDNQRHVVNIGPGTCQGCGNIYIGDHAIRHDIFNTDGFLTALYSRIKSKCNCRVNCNVTCSENDNHDSRPCDQCRVDRPTGYLQIAKVADFTPVNIKHSEHCSLVLYWTNHTDSLLAPNIDTLQLTERIKRLVIRVDILPAFEIPGNRDGDQTEIKRFIIPKECPRCEGSTFMVSYSMYERNAIHNKASKKHKQSYKIIKFLYGQFIYWTEVDKYLNSYYAKVAFLTHCQTCTGEEEDCTRCVTEILQSLVEACASRSLELPEFHALKSIGIGIIDMYRLKLCISSLLSVVSDINSLADNTQRNTQYRPCHVVDLIKRKCLELLDGKLVIEDRHGRCLLRQCNSTVPAINILVTLLEDQELLSDIVKHSYIDTESEEKLKRRLQCPQQERPFLEFRVVCMTQKILSSNISDIRDETVKNQVRDVQEYAKKGWWWFKHLLFLTSSQTIPGRSCSNYDNSSLIPGLEGFGEDGTLTTDSIFTHDLQINWSAVTARQLKRIRKELRRNERHCVLL